MPEITRDMAYAAQSVTQKLDIYKPEKVPAACPVIVYLHPGGFTMGDKQMVQPLIKTILERGYAAVSIDYRLADESRFPAQIADAKAAVRWVRANAGRYHFDSNRIAAWGISAGSTLAALLGTAGNVAEMEDLAMGNASFSSAVNAVVSWYGPMDFNAIPDQRRELGLKPEDESETSGESLMLGGLLAQVPEWYRAASPQTYINEKCPPFYIQHGLADDVVPYLQSVRFAAALESKIAKSKVALKLIEGAGHFDRVHSSPENINAALNFLDRHMSGLS